ncbi:transglutaminaseTgpA domain-containing protein [Marinagarivorans algicola]|uniref:transglutaminase family protein n=1 Tax=Marinagarivorans algicola TaxID=1513270 RepID=UPI0006B92ADC|nr:transglutaminase domain-containing protein [Marinagarivorans algicola]
MIPLQPYLLFSAASLTLGFAGFNTAYNLGYTLIISLCIWVGFFITLLPALTARNKLAEIVAGAGVITFLILLFNSSVLNALIGLLISAQFAINLQANNNNRIYSALLIGLTCLLVGAAQAKNGSFLIYITSFSISSLLALRSLYLYNPHHVINMPVAKNTHDSHITSAANTINSINTQVPRSALHILKICVVFLGLTSIIYLLLPRLPAGNIGVSISSSAHFYSSREWEAQADQATKEPGHIQANIDNIEHLPPQKSTNDILQNTYQYSGFDQSFSINNPRLNPSRFSNVIIAKIKADQPLYLKARVFDRFDGIRWSQSQRQLNKKRLSGGHFQQGTQAKNTIVNITTQASHYQVFIARDNMSTNIPFAEELTELHFPASVIAQDAFGQWFAPQPLTKGTSYSASAKQHFYQGRTFSQITHKTQGVTAANAVAQTLLDNAKDERKAARYQSLAPYLTLPQSLDPQIATFTHQKLQALKHRATDLEKAIYLESFLRQEYHYDFDSIFTSQNSTPLSAFLFETKKGHCEYFASALAIMLRTQNIPTRLVTGWLAHNQNPLTGYYEVRALDGHAWVEAYVDDLGWVLLEPTAYYPMPKDTQIKSQLTARTIQQYIDHLNRIDEHSGHRTTSIKHIIRSTWYSLTLIVTAGLAVLKLVLIDFWWLCIILALIAFISLGLWRNHQGTLKNKFLWYRLRNKAAPSIEQSLQILHTALVNNGHILAAGLTIEQFNYTVAKSYLSQEEQYQLIDLFNQYQYNKRSLNAQQQSRLSHLLHMLMLHQLARPR